MNENNQGQSHSSMNSAAEPRTPPAEIIPAQKRRGPRTATGKKISSENARTHGLLSKVTVLKNESQSDFNSLLKGLRKDRRPVGMLEEILIDKLASDLWRRRRGILVEGAEIEKGVAFLDWEEKERQRMELIDFEDEDEKSTLMQRIANPMILQRCIELLAKLKEQIQRNGLNEDSDEEILIRLYGGSEHCLDTLFDSYTVWHQTASCSDEERQQNGYASVEQCKQYFLEEIDAEIMRLKRYAKAKASIDAQKMKVESLRRNIPDALQLDRLLRYQASLDREISRTLDQLDRVQRMRLGKLVPPIVNTSPPAPPRREDPDGR